MPDHSTIAEFRCRHEQALGEVFSGVLGLCARAGLASVGVVAIDGTKMSANASMNANRDFGQIAREILAEAAEIDRREDELYGSERGDELPEHLRTREGRRKALREAKERLERERNQAAEASADDEAPVTVELDPREFVTRPEGRRAWVREGRRALDAKREREARPIAKDRSDRLFEACRRLEEELEFDHASHAAYEAWRARGVAADGSRRMAPGMVKPHEPVPAPTGSINIERPRLARDAHAGPAAAAGLQRPARRQRPAGHRRRRDHDRVARLRASGTDGPRHPARAARRRRRRSRVVLADAGYWHQRQMKQSSATASRSSSHPTPGYAKAPRPGWTGGLYDFMRRVLATPVGRAALPANARSLSSPSSARSSSTARSDASNAAAEPPAVSEWRLIAATHNLLKLHNHRLSAATA